MSNGYKIFPNDSFYFVTFTVVGWIDIFTRDNYRQLFVDSVVYCQKHKALQVGAWVLMTNHVHMIVASGNPEFPLSGVIRDLKSFTSRHLRKQLETSTQESRKEWMLPLFYQAASNNKKNKSFQFWIQDNHPIELQTPTLVKQRLKYLHDNPVKAGFVYRAEDWMWSSAGAYAGEVSELDLVFLE